MKKLTLIAMLILTNISWSQVSFNGGGSMLVGFGSPGPWGGIHLGFEVPRDDALSFYGRITHHFHKSARDSVALFATAKDFTTSPYTISFNSLPSMNYTMIEGGTRYYLGNGFDYGWAAYGGTNLMLVFNKVRMNHAQNSFDESLYTIDENSRRDGSIFSLGGGLAGGVKYSSARFGTFYTDININYMLIAQGSQQNIFADLYRSLIFSFNMGWRKDIIW